MSSRTQTLMKENGCDDHPMFATLDLLIYAALVTKANYLPTQLKREVNWKEQQYNKEYDMITGRQVVCH